MFRILSFGLLLLIGFGLGKVSAEGLPPTPTQYVTDEAGVITPGLIAQLNQRLSAFEKQTSNQIVAVVYPKLADGQSIEEYAQQLYSAWHIGQKKTSNGVLIIICVQDHKAWIQTGYGLEGAMPDVLCARIVRETMSPAFRSGNYGAGLASGIMAVMQATKGEYKGSARSNGKPTTLKDFIFSPLGFFLLVMIVLTIIGRNRRRGGPGSGGGMGLGSAAATGFFLGSMGSGFGGGGNEGGGGGDSGGFSGGGGDSGGGGGGGDC